jgi:microcystin-dependent protein
MDPFVGELRIFSFAFPPKGWALCNGQLISIQQNTALFSLIGTFYGGNGVTTFALPNLQGRVPLHMSAAFPLGSAGGEATHALNVNELPAHVHGVAVSTALTGGTAVASNGFLGPGDNVYTPQLGVAPPLAGDTVATVGSSQPHENMQPYTTLSICIALLGIFPARS